MEKILWLVVLSLFAISASAADLMASSAAPTVTQNIVVENATCPGVGATGFSTTGLLLSCQSGLWAKAMGDVASGTTCGRRSRYGSGTTSTNSNFLCQGHDPYTSCPAGYSQVYFREGNSAGTVYFYECAKD
jgi:hypothetical protein